MKAQRKYEIAPEGAQQKCEDSNCVCDYQRHEDAQAEGPPGNRRGQAFRHTQEKEVSATQYEELLWRITTQSSLPADKECLNRSRSLLRFRPRYLCPRLLGGSGTTLLRLNPLRKPYPIHCAIFLFDMRRGSALGISVGNAPRAGEESAGYHKDNG
jgi:hypothetical protein